MAGKKKSKIEQVLEILKTHSEIFNKHALKFLEHDDKFDKMDAKIDRKFDQVLTGQDKIISELAKIREDRVISKGKEREQDQRIDSLDTRVRILETSRV